MIGLLNKLCKFIKFSILAINRNIVLSNKKIENSKN